MFARPGGFVKNPKARNRTSFCRLLAGREFGPTRFQTKSDHGSRGPPSKASRAPPENLALAELEALAGALLPVLLAFLHARIARQKAVLAQPGAQFRIEDGQRAGKAHSHGS